MTWDPGAWEDTWMALLIVFSFFASLGTVWLARRWERQPTCKPPRR